MGTDRPGTGVQAALSDTCSATVDDLFPQQYNVTEIKAALNRTNPALSSLLPSPFVGFTLILTGDQAFANADSASRKPSLSHNSAVTYVTWLCVVQLAGFGRMQDLATVIAPRVLTDMEMQKPANAAVFVAMKILMQEQSLQI